MLRAITTRPPMAKTSLQALAAAMAPKSSGSSTSGGKKSVVDTRARSRAEPVDGRVIEGRQPQQEGGSVEPASCRSRPERGTLPIWPAHPPQEVHSVSFNACVIVPT